MEHLIRKGVCRCLPLRMASCPRRVVRRELSIALPRAELCVTNGMSVIGEDGNEWPPAVRRVGMERWQHHFRHVRLGIVPKPKEHEHGIEPTTLKKACEVRRAHILVKGWRR